MEQYVLDTSILVQSAIEDSESLRVANLLSRLEGDFSISLHVPEFCLVEYANVLWKQVRFHGTNVEEAKQALRNLLVLPLNIHAAADLTPRALEIAVQHGLAIYDCVHIALAEKLKISLVTTDVKQAAVALTIGITLKPITDFPEFTEPD